MEQWKAIPEFEGFYEASNLGNIRSLTLLLPWKSKTGTPGERVRKGKVLSPGRARYLQVNMSLGNKRFPRYVHRLVAQTFLPNPENKKEVDHINGDRYDNRIENLRWVTPSENMTAAYDNNQQHHGTANHQAKLSEDQVFQIIEMYKTSGMSQSKIGELFEVSQTQIGNIVRGDRWKRVTQ